MGDSLLVECALCECVQLCSLTLWLHPFTLLELMRQDPHKLQRQLASRFTRSAWSPGQSSRCCLPVGCSLQTRQHDNRRTLTTKSVGRLGTAHASPESQLGRRSTKWQSKWTWCARHNIWGQNHKFHKTATAAFEYLYKHERVFTSRGSVVALRHRHLDSSVRIYSSGAVAIADLCPHAV